MAKASFEILRRSDLHRGLAALADLADAAGDPVSFARAGVEVLPRLVASDLTTLSWCNLRSGERTVVASSASSIGAEERAAFDRHFHDHPLVRHHGYEAGRQSHRISDSMSQSQFRQTPLYVDYYRRIGLDRALALPLHVDGELLVSFVFNRRGRDFSDRELALLEAMRPSLAALHRRAVGDDARSAHFGLTPREAEAMRWVGAGKTDRDIADILGISVRTIHKHLQHSFAKLGVENRTAAAMRLGRPG